MIAKNAKDMSGQIIGNWLVIDRNEERTKQAKNAYWNCKCLLCNDLYVVRGSELRNGKSTKCRKCSSKSTRKNELNNKYNQLTVIKELGPKNNRIMWLCSCSCGNEIAVSGTDLRTGKVQSCGKCPDKKSLGEKEIISLLYILIFHQFIV